MLHAADFAGADAAAREGFGVAVGLDACVFWLSSRGLDAQTGDVVELGGFDVQIPQAEMLCVVADPDSGFGGEEGGEEGLGLGLVLRFSGWDEGADVL